MCPGLTPQTPLIFEKSKEINCVLNKNESLEQPFSLLQPSVKNRNLLLFENP